MGKKTTYVDPFARREAEKYEKPIPSRELLLEYINKATRPIKRKQLEELLKLEDPEQQEALRRRLKAMMRDGQIVKHKGGFSAITPVSERSISSKAVTGVFRFERDGGSIPGATGTGKIFLSFGQIHGLCEGDTIAVKIVGSHPKFGLSGTLLQVKKPVTPTFIGQLRILENNAAIVEPRHKYYRHPLPVSMMQVTKLKAQSGDWVRVRINRGKQPTQDWQADIQEVLKGTTQLNLETEAAIEQYKLPHVWPKAVKAEIKSLAPTIAPAAKRGRLDLRTVPLVTIDGEDARDFDDAVYAENKPRGGHILWVAIADVSYYVKPGTALDTEAIARGNSVYFPHHVIPMLPEVLSNGLCSLNPEVDRLCMAVEMHLTKEGKLTRFQFHRAIMRSAARLTYTSVANYFQHKKAPSAWSPEVIESLDTLKEVFEKLITLRKARGAIDFDTTEMQFSFNKEGKIEKITPRKRNIAHRIIEECMLMANVAAAKQLIRTKLLGLFRVHHGPTPEKLKDLRTYLGHLGLTLEGKDKPQPADYGVLIDKIAGRDDAAILQTVLLRSLSQAIYTPENAGHFGLAYEAYVHFTSPIRRYPDLMIHRALVESLKEKPSKKYLSNLEELGAHCSATERRADEATRDVTLALKCYYAEAHVGEIFDAVITGITSFGFFAELKSLLIDGLVHVGSLGNDYFVYDSGKQCLIGERTRITYGIGDPVKVQLVRVDPMDRKIDLVLAGEETQVHKGNKKNPEKDSADPKKKKRSRRRK